MCVKGKSVSVCWLTVGGNYVQHSMFAILLSSLFSLTSFAQYFFHFSISCRFLQFFSNFIDSFFLFFFNLLVICPLLIAINYVYILRGHLLCGTCRYLLLFITMDFDVLFLCCFYDIMPLLYAI